MHEASRPENLCGDIAAPGNRPRARAQQVRGAPARPHLIPVCRCCKTPPGFRGLLLCFQGVGVRRNELFPFCGNTHTSSVLLLLPKFTLLAKCQHATIFGHELTSSNLLRRSLSALYLC